MSKTSNLDHVKAYFDKRIQEHGASPRGSDWNSEASQNIRFEQLLRIVESRSFSLLDYGCGYGALADYLTTKGQSPNDDYRMIEELGFVMTR